MGTVRGALIIAALLAPRVAAAFCGFYVAGGEQKMFNDATQVVLMRSGARTVLSMQNNYKGPPEAFALVIPVPVVLHEADVKTLSTEIFAHVEQLGAPRLVEYWEQDPCLPPIAPDPPKLVLYKEGAVRAEEAAKDHGVTIEAKFRVGEYQIVILSAKEATGLETWLRENKYNIPPGAEPLLRPYVEANSKFFVAKVDPQKVTFEGTGPDRRAALSPLRFHYDADDFTLPIRLGLANSAGTQDLIVNIIAPERYEVANYPNVTIPTNLDVQPSIKDKFGSFYAALFDRTLEKHPGAVITEYAWQTSSCDPCPGPVLDPSDLATLGGNVLDGTRERPIPVVSSSFVLTRLHARYGKDIKDDLVFKQASPIAGGRETLVAGGQLEQGARPDPINNFQGRYAIRHAWTGPIRCEHPRRGEWGGPPAEITAQAGFAALGTKPALDLAFAPRNAVELASAVTRDIPEIGLRANASDIVGSSSGTVGGAVKKKTGCGCQSTDAAGGILFVGGLLVILRTRKR
ncbi:MAG: hypothetical protein JWO36_2260 [Myxococcales bacterium]|nr:hypothetical protein [Myxococcales bacterium]